jgi:hypothetical protein
MTTQHVHPTFNALKAKMLTYFHFKLFKNITHVGNFCGKDNWNSPSPLAPLIEKFLLKLKHCQLETCTHAQTCLPFKLGKTT